MINRGESRGIWYLHDSRLVIVGRDWHPDDFTEDVLSVINEE